ncbi:apoptosis-associated speck-like protein containing a CARD [Puntigrus tetrazona]|uniref:apoptosis-associated speck-like protein containing a CARD n=1 Tax=Puntigrus tetrazona TaxID=1606681 RepID=UPI001C8A76A9|nr:apoptosis-associated speck-like protein containing a CARD [Puntigrus tetrazona]
MAKSVKDHLQDIFDDLGAGGQKKFKSKLLDWKSEPRVRRAAIEKIEDSIDLAELMVNTFTTSGAVAVTIDILRAIGCNEQANDLTESTGQKASNVPSAETGAPSAEDFIDKNRTELINRVSNVDGVLDELLQMRIITEEAYSDIRSEKTSQSKMRLLLSGPIKSAGRKGKEALYKALKKVEPCLTEDLE